MLLLSVVIQLLLDALGLNCMVLSWCLNVKRSP